MDCDQRTALCSSKSFHLAGAVCTALLAAFVAYVGALRTQTYVLVGSPATPCLPPLPP